MGQTEVVDFLGEEYKKDCKRWFTVKEIKEGLKGKGFSNGIISGVPNDLFKLALFNQIQSRAVGLLNQHKEFKAYRQNAKR